ncbi:MULTISPECIES: GNAT family N-acetyltransferase [unclassified Luteococcus]|uniref:GNAT family N-acetyltransferase n=1 Tax=unclassified Luteococcus TaxID=2639923 RepID=UPI00313EF504
MTEFFETFNNGARYLREEKEFQKVNVVQAKRAGRGPQPLDLESGRIVLVRPGERVASRGLTVQRASADEYQATGRVAVHAYLDGGELRHDDPYLDVLRDVASRDRQAEVWVVLDQDRVVGTLTWCPEGSPLRELAGPGEGEFRMLAVDPAAQGSGAGRLLVEAAVSRARADGLAAIVISSSPWMTTAHALYRSLGFVRAPELDWSPRPDVQLLAFRLEL